jgi:hypothetical protein
MGYLEMCGGQLLPQKVRTDRSCESRHGLLRCAGTTLPADVQRRGARLMKMFTGAAMVCILSLLPNEQLQGQQRLTVSDKPSCVACTIELTRVTRLGGPLDSLYFDLGAAVIARYRRGRIYIGPREPLGPAAVTVYDSAGRYITALARRGMGGIGISPPVARAMESRA